MLHSTDRKDMRPQWLRAHERFLPEDIPKDGWRADDPELLDEVTETEDLPNKPFPFAWFMINRHFRAPVMRMTATMLLVVMIESMGPLALGKLMDLISAREGGTGMFALLLTGLAVVWLVNELGTKVYDLQNIYVGPKLRTLTQKYLFQYMLGHSPRYFQDNFSGRLAQKIRTAGEAVNAMLQLTLRDFLLASMTLLMGLVLLTIEAPLYAAILAGWAALYIGVVGYLARHCSNLAFTMSDRWSTVTGKLVDSISNADAVRAFARNLHERRYVSRYLYRAMAGTMRIYGFVIVMRIFQGLAMWLLRVVMIGMAAWQAWTGAMTMGTLTLIVLLVMGITQQLRYLSFQILDFFEVRGNLEEALDIITVPHDITDAPGAPALKVTKGAITFEDVTFRHADGTTVFDNLNLEIRPGEKIGLVGRSGAGKSTLIKLLRRQFEPTSGRVLIDGQDVSKVTWDSVNNAVAEVPQVPSIFHRTIRDNIRYATPLADDTAVLEAAAKAHAHEFISKRNTAYDTIVGEQGIKLSGGERQRVAIARAFVKNARILVLDEATSALDSESEHMIQSALFELMKDRTVIAIAHRLSTITGLDRIIVLDEGRIIEEGNHDSLIAGDGTYAALWARQAGGFAEDAA